ncbi:MAG: hypothetical protein GY949_12890 [Gammaproteobacteria bacterium]|nr:hypothetical protein [Gammaproteobacteria bacterium]
MAAFECTDGGTTGKDQGIADSVATVLLEDVVIELDKLGIHAMDDSVS